TDLSAQVPFRRLRRDWLLLLQLVLLVLLVLAAAGPYRRSLEARAGKAVLVLDASAGMSADGRFEAAAAAAGKFVDGMGPRAEAAVVRAGSRAELVVPLTSDRAALRAGIAACRAGGALASLTEAVALARGLLGPPARSPGALVLFTDGARMIPDAADLSVVTVGRPVGNVGIVAFGLRARDASGAHHQAFVSLRNASAAPVRGTLRLLVDGALRDAAEVELAPDAEANRTLELPGVVEGNVEAVFEAETPDAFPLDDRAAWVLRRPALRRYRVRGKADPWLLRALAANDDWSAAKDAEPFDLEVVVGLAPGKEGPPLLWIDPPGAALDPPSSGKANGLAILGWDRTHPALRFAELSRVRLGNLPRIVRPAGGRVLAESAAGPLVVEGTRAGRRYLLWAFDPLETDLPLRAAYPLLVRNALEVLAPPDGSLPGGVPAAAPVQAAWPSGEALTLVSPSGKRTALSSSAGVVTLPARDEIGVHRVVSASREVRFASSLLSREESDLRPRFARTQRAPAAGGEIAPETVPVASVAETWRPLAALALALLLLEAFAFHRRWEP
ncbi:MAG TPA: VWA domain-containing protein, partial [Thermoanaerobaculia bacterium]|nr:VWA domain-containing protein [Thermoanaerobaculia bacterium]